MGKRKNKNKPPPPAEVVAKKPHVEKEDSFAESYEKFKQTRGSEDASLMKKLVKFYASIEKTAKSDQQNDGKDEHSSKINASRIFQPIIHATLIHLCNHPDESPESLTDILKSWSKAKKEAATVDGKGDEKKEPQVDDEPAWADVTMDAVISMLPSCNNRCLRLFLQGCKRITHHTTLNVVESITAPLTGLEDEDASDEDASDEDGDKDDTMQTNEEECSESASDDDVEEQEDVSEDDDEWEEIEEGEEESKELEKLKAKLHGILYGTRSDNTASGVASQVPAVEDESENEVDDEAMFALDDAIAEAFKDKFASKKSVLDAKAETFKCRMLKLIQCYTSQRERKEDILILLAHSTLPLMKAASSSREFRSRLIETLGDIFDVKNKKCAPVHDEQCLQIHGEILKYLLQHASKAKSADESTVYAKGINWLLKIHPSPLTDAVSENVDVSTLTSSTFVTLSHISSRSTALQLVKLLVNHLTCGSEKEELKPLQLAHAYEIISHALNKCLQNNGRGGGGSDELPADICKQVCSLAKDKATQLSSQMNDGKCNWLLLSSVMQTLNYLKIIYAKNSQHFTLDAQLMQSFTKITGKNRKKLPKPGQIALKGLLSGSKGGKNNKRKPVGDKVDENTPSTNTKAAPAPANTVAKKSRIPLPKSKLISSTT